MSRKTRRYTEEERLEALRLSVVLGLSEASRQLGIPLGTLSSWRSVRVRDGRFDPSSVQTSATKDEQSVSSRESDNGHEPEVVKAEPTTSSTEQNSGSGHRKKRVARIYSPSQRAQALELAEQIGVTEAAKQLGMSRFSIYYWQQKVERAARGADDCPTSGPDPNELIVQRDREILEMWRRNPGLGPSQIRNQLRREGKKVSVATVRRVMEDAGYVLPKVRRDEHKKLYTAVRPNHLWHLDFVHRYIGKQSSFSLIMIDDCSRYVTGFGVADAERSDVVLESFEQAVERHGRPESVMNDKGSAFWSWRGISRFTRLLEEMGIDQIVAEHKEWNGKVEVFNGNLHKEFFDKHRFYDVSEMRRRLEHHIHWYNHKRTHHALGGLLVPADRYFGRSQEVLARIEAGGISDDADPLDVKGRALDLFKVASKDGKPEVWLMGEKIF
jgi:transposase InsO family protein